MLLFDDRLFRRRYANNSAVAQYRKLWAGRIRGSRRDRTWEFSTCDDGWAYSYCSFAESPFPTVVFAYDRVKRQYLPATPRFATQLREQISSDTEAAQKQLSETGGKDLGVDKCVVLRPVLGLMYSGRFDDGVVLLRRLYQGADRNTFEPETTKRVRESALWVAR